MRGKQKILSWLVSSLVMYLISYWWHGIFTFDLAKMTLGIKVYLICAAPAYLFIGFLVSKAIDLKFFEKIENVFMRGIVAGGLTGFLIYILSFVVDIPFAKMIEMKHLILNIAWQVVEQGIGGLIAALVIFAVPDYHRFQDPD